MSCIVTGGLVDRKLSRSIMAWLAAMLIPLAASGQLDQAEKHYLFSEK
jgi:hypothetical protein